MGLKQMAKHVWLFSRIGMKYQDFRNTFSLSDRFLLTGIIAINFVGAKQFVRGSKRGWFNYKSKFNYFVIPRKNRPSDTP